MPTRVKNAKIAMLDIDLRKTKLAMGIEVLVNDPAKLAAIRQKETDLTNDRIKAILKAGANVVLTTKGIDDTSLKLFVEAGVMAVRRCARADLKSLARVTGGEWTRSLMLLS
jgi:T-complex protein 1 subunit alpha